MSEGRKDDGSIRDGVMFSIAIALAFFLGYYFRDSGYVIRIEPNRPAPIAPLPR